MLWQYKNFVVEKNKTDPTSQLSAPGLQLLANLALAFQRTGTLLVELISLLSETLDLLFQT
jgi:hypothetical protein